MNPPLQFPSPDRNPLSKDIFIEELPLEELTQEMQVEIDKQLSPPPLPSFLPADGSRYKLLTVSPEHLISVLQINNLLVLQSDIPKDAIIRNVYFTEQKNVFQILLEHESFELIPAGDPIPFLTGPVIQICPPYQLQNDLRLSPVFHEQENPEWQDLGI